MGRWLIESSRSNLCAFRWGIGHTGQEAVELHQELEVDIVALGGSAVSALDVVAVEIDTCEVKPSSAIWFKHAQEWATLSCAFANKMVPWSQRKRHDSALLLYSHTEAELQYLHVPMAAVVAVKFGDVGYRGGCVEQHFLSKNSGLWDGGSVHTTRSCRLRAVIDGS